MLTSFQLLFQFSNLAFHLLSLTHGTALSASFVLKLDLQITQLLDERSAFVFGLLILGSQVTLVVVLDGLEVDLQAETSVFGNLAGIFQFFNCCPAFKKFLLELTLGSFQVVYALSYVILGGNLKLQN